MPSKRDQLRKLKEGRKKEPIQEMSSPVDDTLKKLDDNGEPIAEEREDHVNGVDIVKMQEETVVEDAKEKEANAEPVTEPVSEPISRSADEKTNESADEKMTESANEPINEATNEPATEAVSGSENESVSKSSSEPAAEAINEQKEAAVASFSTEKAEEPVKEIKKQPAAEKKKEATKRTSMALLVENNKYIRLRSIQLGMSIQEYVNLLIDEEIEREKNGQMADLNDIENNLDMNYRRGQNSAIVALVLKESNARFLKRGGAMHGMNATAFFNHIVSEERRREEEQGPRQGEYDVF